MFYSRHVSPASFPQIRGSFPDSIRQGEEDGHHYRPTNAEEVLAELPSVIPASWGELVFKNKGARGFTEVYVLLLFLVKVSL